MQTPGVRPRLTLTARVVAGTVGAYAMTSLAIAALARLLAWFGMDRVEAVLAATLASFAIFAIISMAVFHARSVWRAWAWLALCAGFCGLLLWLLTLPEGQ